MSDWAADGEREGSTAMFGDRRTSEPVRQYQLPGRCRKAAVQWTNRRFRTQAAERRTVLLGYVGFFEAYFDGEIDLFGDRAVGGLMRKVFSGAYRYRANPLLLVKRRYLEWRGSNRDFARAKANARHHYGLPFEFFRSMLGDDCLYAEGYWSEGTTTLAAAQRL